MKTISDQEAQGDLQQVLDSAQEERVLITRDGKPTAVVLGLESYAAEDLELAGSQEFWRMIEQRRHQGTGSLRRKSARTTAPEAFPPRSLTRTTSVSRSWALGKIRAMPQIAFPTCVTEAGSIPRWACGQRKTDSN